MLEISNIEGSNFGTASNVYDVYDQYHDKDIFESVIDGLILERYADDSVKEYIKNLPRSEKRIATLSLIGDDNILWSNINDLLEDNKSGYQRLKLIYNLLKEYVKIADVDRKGKGEILTPFKELAEPMVRLVEKYDTDFWKNPHHKVLDSSAGYGTFLILAAYKFMVGLKDFEPNEEKRFKWVVENCLYYGEIQAKSAFSWLVTIDPYNEYKTNIYWGDFLSKDFDRHMKEVWNVEYFDLIIQNPPYQMNTGNRGSGHTLWNKFVLKSLSILIEDGYMVMVHPSGWRNISGAFDVVKNEITKRSLLYLEIHDINDGIKMFGASTRYDFYCLKNSDHYISTDIVDEDRNEVKMNIKDMKFIPNRYFKEFIKLTSHNDPSVDLVYSRSMYGADKKHIISEKSFINKYPCVKYISKINYNIDFRYSDRDSGMFGIPKVMFGIGAQVGGILIDKNGDYGLCQFVAAISDKDYNNLENIKKALESSKFKDIMKACQFTTQMYNYKVISLLKKDFWVDFI